MWISFQQGGHVNPSLIDLEHILDTETGLFRRLLEVMGRERKALLGSQLEKMHSASADRDILVQQLQAIEERRSELVRQFGERQGWPAGDLTLSRLAEASPEPRGSELRRYRQELQGLVERLREENRRSRMLCRHAGDLLKAACGIAKGLAAEGCVYRPGGRTQARRLNGKLVCDEV
jgi:flagellar biosynthesis/type III secretory pathway chaperone